MIVVMRAGANEEYIARISEQITESGFTPHLSRGAERTLIGVNDREFQPVDTVLDIDGITIGNGEFAVIAGPA